MKLTLQLVVALIVLKLKRSYILCPHLVYFIEWRG